MVNNDSKKPSENLFNDLCLGKKIKISRAVNLLSFIRTRNLLLNFLNERFCITKKTSFCNHKKVSSEGKYLGATKIKRSKGIFRQN